MRSIDHWSDVLSVPIRAVWPIVARAVTRLHGCLMGGTALAVHLRHRESYDLDYMAGVGFSGLHLCRDLEATAQSCQLIQAETDSMHAVVDGVPVQVFRQPHRGVNPGYVKQLQRPHVIDGMPVASLPDLLASKLDVIMYRPKLRDYIDIVAIDRSGLYRIEDGLAFHIERYGTQLQSSVLDHIVGLLTDPGRLSSDRAFESARHDTLAHLTARIPELRRHLTTMREGTAEAPPAEPPTLRPPASPAP